MARRSDSKPTREQHHGKAEPNAAIPPKPGDGYVWHAESRQWLSGSDWLRATQHLHRPIVQQMGPQDAEVLADVLLELASIMRDPRSSEEELAAVRRKVQEVRRVLMDPGDEARNYLIALSREAAGCGDGVVVPVGDMVEQFIELFPEYAARFSIVDMLDMVEAWKANRRGAPAGDKRVRATRDVKSGTIAFEACARVWQRVSGISIASNSCESAYHRWVTKMATKG